MKKILLLFILIFVGFTIFAQDYLYKTSGEKIAVKIIENDGTNLKYQLFGSRDQRILSIPISDIYMVDFEDRGMEFINSQTPVSSPANQNQTGSPNTSAIQPSQSPPKNNSELEKFDLIKLNNGTTIRGVITEVSPTAIVYKLTDSGQLKQITPHSVESITYKDGRIQTFTYTQSNSSKNREKDLSPYQHQITQREFTEDKIEQEWSPWKSQLHIAPGYGNGYGGTGVQVQYTLTKNENFSLGVHIGVGIILEWKDLASSNLLAYSGGIKIYPLNNFYLNLQFGGFGIYNQITSQHNGQIEFHQKMLLGPAVLLGYDYFITNNLGINAGVGICYDINAGQNIYYALDAGIIYRF